MIIDEFPNYTTTALSSLLSEARKYRLSLTLAHQYLEQMLESVKAAVFGNVGSLIVFRIGAQDAEELSRELDLSADHLSDIANFEAWYKILNHGHPTSTNRLLAAPPPKTHGNRDKIIKHSRIHFATAKEKVEKRIMRFLTEPKKPDTDWPDW